MLYISCIALGLNIFKTCILMSDECGKEDDNKVGKAIDNGSITSEEDEVEKINIVI